MQKQVPTGPADCGSPLQGPSGPPPSSALLSGALTGRQTSALRSRGPHPPCLLPASLSSSAVPHRHPPQGTPVVPAPTAFLLACEHRSSSSVKHRPTPLRLGLSSAAPCPSPPRRGRAAGRLGALSASRRSPQWVWSVVVWPPAAASDAARHQVPKRCRARAPWPLVPSSLSL